MRSDAARPAAAGRLTPALDVLALLAAGAPVPGCARRPEVRVEDAWVRSAERTSLTAGYFTLVNDGRVPLVLASVSCPLAADTRMHTTVRDRGIVSMHEVDHFDVPARSRLRFRPGGNHLMLIDLRTRLLPGASAPLTLRLGDGRTLEATARVRS